MNQPSAPSDLPDSIKANINHGEPRPLDGRSGEPDRAGAPAKVEKKQTAERPLRVPPPPPSIRRTVRARRRALAPRCTAVRHCAAS